MLFYVRGYLCTSITSIRDTIFSVDPSNSVHQYIQEQMQNGMSSQQIVNQLLLAGWTLQSLQMYAPELFSRPATQADAGVIPQPVPIQPNSQTIFTPQQTVPQVNDFSVTPAVSAVATNSKVSMLKSRFFILLAITVVIAAVGVIAYLLFVSKNGTSSKNLNDPNFSMSIPEGWTGDASYQPGSTVVLFYSPEDSDKENREKAALFTGYIGLNFDRIEQQIKYFEESKAEYNIINDEKFDSDGTSYRLVEYTVKGSGQSEATHTLMITATKGDFIINADVVSKDTSWELHAQEADTMLRSITPACDNISEKNEVSSGVMMLCS